MISELETGPVVLKGLITKADAGKTNKNTPYLNLILEDASGILDAKFWNLTEEQVRTWKPGMIVEAKGDLNLYRNAPQLRVRTLKLLEDENLMDYVRSAPESRQQMEKEVDRLLSEMKNPVIRDVTGELLNMYREEFFSWPAAVRNHHNYPGGLAYHTLSMARIGLQMAAMYEWLDSDLLMAGILLHDLGKVMELSAPILPEYTPQGNLVGHISIASTLIDRVAVILELENTEEVMLLKHMVLSHHGKHEYGSPVLPMIPEAEILNLIDNIDARMVMMHEALKEVTPGTFGPRVFALDNRMLYRRKGSEEPDENESEKPGEAESSETESSEVQAEK